MERKILDISVNPKENVRKTKQQVSSNDPIIFETIFEIMSIKCQKSAQMHTHTLFPHLVANDQKEFETLRKHEIRKLDFLAKQTSSSIR